MTAASALLARLGIADPSGALWVGDRSVSGTGPELRARSAIDGSILWTSPSAGAEQIDTLLPDVARAFSALCRIPAPRRGELVRELSRVLRQEKDSLASLVSLEVGKIRSEALGEVQEMIDICDFANGLSRQLHGLTIASERPEHRLTEHWHPLGPVGIISAFNFPVAVWAWNAALAIVCGNPVIWKPSEKAPLSAIAVHALTLRAARAIPDFPVAAFSLVLGGGADVGQRLATAPSIPLVSATGSVRMGRAVATAVAERLGRCLLELGWNNAAIVAPSADQELALRSVVFSAAGTSGQRCTSLRRLIVHESVADAFVGRLATTYARLEIGDPRDERVLLGPLIDEAAFGALRSAIDRAVSQGGRLVTGGERVTAGVPEGGVYVRPAIVEIGDDAPIVQEETFAPLLYVHRYAELDDAIRMNNSVPQGLSSAIFTSDLREAERFTGPAGSDCGIVNVNTGTSGAEIGGAFGGEKQTGGGREAGSDAWKSYMRRATSAVNYGTGLPLSQGVTFPI